MRGTLYGIGVGPGDPELITLKAIRIMKQCQVIAIPGANPEESVAFQIAKKAFSEIDAKEKLFVATPMHKDFVVLENNYKRIAKQIEERLEQGMDVGFLTLGDPTIYSTYIYIHRHVVADGYEAEIVNGVPSFCAAAAYAGESLVDRNESLHIVPASYEIEKELALSGTKVLMKAGGKIDVVKNALTHFDANVFMVENCGLEQERIYRGVDEIPDAASYFSLVIVKNENI